MPLGRLQSLTHLCMFKGLTDEKLKLFDVHVNYNDNIYYILFAFIIQTYSIIFFNPQLKLEAKYLMAKLGLTRFLCCQLARSRRWSSKPG